MDQSFRVKVFIGHHCHWWELGCWEDFFLGDFCQILKHQVQDIYRQMHWLKKPMLAYGKKYGQK